MVNVMYFSVTHSDRTSCFTYPGGAGSAGTHWGRWGQWRWRGPLGGLWVQGWTETNPDGQERDEERSLQTQSLNAAFPFPEAAAISRDGEGLPRSTHQSLKLRGMSISPGKLTSSSTGECAYTCVALVVPWPVRWQPQHPGSGRACAWLLVSPRAAPASKEMEEDPYHSL